MRTKDRVAIGMVTNGSIDADLVIDLLTISRTPDTKFDSFIQVGNIGTTTRSRNLVCANFLDTTECEWLFFIDSDERLPIATWNKLLDTAHDKERPIVSGLVFAAFFDEQDNLQPTPTIYLDNEQGQLTSFHTYPTNSVIQVSACGTGALLIHRSVLQAMRDKKPVHQGKDWCFFIEGSFNGKDYFGEDLLFCRRATSLGFPIHAHTGAILKHRKTFMLDDRHHAPIRESLIAQQKN